MPSAKLSVKNAHVMRATPTHIRAMVANKLHVIGVSLIRWAIEDLGNDS